MRLPEKTRDGRLCRFPYLLFRGLFDGQQEIKIFPCDRQCRIPCHLHEGKQTLVFDNVAKKKEKKYF